MLHTATGWRGELQLGFFKAAGITTLHREHRGPLRLQRPLYPEPNRPDICHVYVLHPPGGVVGGDSLTLKADASAGTHAVMTTPGATKFYRSTGAEATVEQSLVLRDNAVLEWLPQENIFFDSSNTTLHTQVDMHKGCGFCGWEIHCFGRPAGENRFTQGRMQARLSVSQNSVPLLTEQLHQDSESSENLLQRATGMRDFSVIGTLIIVGSGSRHVSPDLLALLRDKLPHERLALTQIENVLLARYLGHRADEAKSLFAQVRSLTRKPLFGLDAYEPRIWLT